MELKAELKYTKSHEWVLKDGDVATIGLTDYAQSELGDLVFVNLPQEGDEVEVASDVYSPVSGTVSAINEDLLDAPESINEAPYDAWFIKVTDISEEEELLSAEEYEKFVEESEE